MLMFPCSGKISRSFIRHAEAPENYKQFYEFAVELAQQLRNTLMIDQVT